MGFGESRDRLNCQGFYEEGVEGLWQERSKKNLDGGFLELQDQTQNTNGC